GPHPRVPAMCRRISSPTTPPASASIRRSLALSISPRPPRATLFPYTTLFRSLQNRSRGNLSGREQRRRSSGNCQRPRRPRPHLGPKIRQNHQLSALLNHCFVVIVSPGVSPAKNRACTTVTLDPSMCEVPDRLLQRHLIIHVKPSRMPIDLSQQPPENLPRPDFHKRLHALPNQ